MLDRWLISVLTTGDASTRQVATTGEVSTKLDRWLISVLTTGEASTKW